MNYRKIPNGKESVSILGLGCMRFPLMEDGKIDEKQVEEMMVYGIEKGINYIDTAWGYHGGESESLVGKILEKTGLRDRVNVVTKLPSYLIKKKEDLDYYFNEQLKRLRVDKIDYYLVHTLTEVFWKNVTEADIFSFLDRIKAEGKVGHVGFSFHDELPLFKTIVDAYPWDFCMIQYNYLDTEYQAGRAGLEYATEKGLGVFVMEPLRGGGLVNNISPDIMAEWEGSSKGYKPVEWGLRWVWNHPNVTLLLSGMSSFGQIKENIEIAERVKDKILDDDDLDRIERVKKLYKNKIKVNCTGCNYCMPCPFGVDIPGAFEFYNNASMFNDVEKFSKSYEMFVKEGARADQCKACGKCEPQCPQGIKIISELKNVAETLQAKI
ncbi:MAG: aldo/keto reductase [Fusobacteriaceae bacterium]